MKKIFATETRYLNSDLALLVGRMAFGILMLLHGLPKLDMLISGSSSQFPSVFGMGPDISLTLAVFAEVGCSLFILIGLGTRLVTIPLIITMLVAIFSIHAADAFSKKEMAVLYLSAYVILFFAGSGKYSLDYILFVERRKRYYAPTGYSV